MENNAEQMHDESTSESYDFDEAFDAAAEEFLSEGDSEESEAIQEEGEPELVYGLPKDVYEERRAAGWMTKEEWEAKGGDPDLHRPWGAFKEHGDMISRLKQLEQQNRKQQELFEEQLGKLLHKQEEADMRVVKNEHVKLEMDIKKQIREAREDGDWDREDILQDKLRELDRKRMKDELLAEFEVEDEEEVSEEPQPLISQEKIQEIETRFLSNNPWYEQHKDLENYVNQQTLYLVQQEGKDPEEALNMAANSVRQNFPDHVAFKRTQRAASKVADTSHRGNATKSAKGGAFGDLPDNIKALYVTGGFKDMYTKEKFAEIYGKGAERT